MVRHPPRTLVSAVRVRACRDRRSHPRFGPDTVEAEAWIQPQLIDARWRDSVRVINLSCSGVCIETTGQLPKIGSICGLVLDLGAPFDREVLTTIRIKWVSKARSLSGVQVGAEFLYANTGWLGPDDEVVQ